MSAPAVAEERQSGRTTRMAQEALDAVRAGQKVAVITHSRRFEETYLKPLLRHLGATTKEIDRLRFYVADPHLRFTLRGEGFDKILHDHAAWTVRP